MSSRLLTCSFCGLPYRGSGAEEEKHYCCYGCYLVDSMAGGKGDGSTGSSQASWILARVFLATFFAMGVMVFSIVLYAPVAFPAAEGSGHPLGPLAPIVRWLTLGFATPAVLLLGLPLLAQSVPLHVRGRPLIAGAAPSAVNLLIALGALTAYVLSVVNLSRGEGEVYFETSVMLLLLVTVGRYLEANAKARARESLGALLELSPETARRVDGSAAETGSVPTSELVVGDIVRVLEGERLPADGEVVRGAGAIDTAMVTGESDPRRCATGDYVFGGTTCVEGTIDVRVVCPPGSRLLDRLAHLMDEARLRRPRLEHAAETASRWFLRLTLLVSAATLIGWGLSVGWLEAGLHAMAVLLIACPCALGIAAPLASRVAIGRAARLGVLVRGGAVLEALARPGVVFFDKTGTLTAPRLELARVLPVRDESESLLLTVAGALARFSTHPVARAAEEAALAAGSELAEVHGYCGHAGLGMTGVLRGEPVVAGNRVLFERELGDSRSREALDELDGTLQPEETPLFVARGGRVLGALTFREQLRPGAREVLRWLEERRWRTEVLTGDRPARGAALGRGLDVVVRAGLRPEEKVARVEEAAASGDMTAMVGDGLNDAPVLASADVGIALGSAAHLAREAADVVVLDWPGRPAMEALRYLFALASSTARRIRWNLFWAFGYNAVGMSLAAGGLVHPLLAAVLMIISSLSVVGTSLAAGPSPDVAAGGGGTTPRGSGEAPSDVDLSVVEAPGASAP